MLLLLTILVLLLPNFVHSLSCDCLANPKCAKLRDERSETPSINCSLLTPFEKIHRGNEVCKYSSFSYHCALDIDHVNTYGELCVLESTVHQGYRPSKELGLNQRPCRDGRYQPFPIDSNLTFQCIYEKSKCSEVGQKVVHTGTTQTDADCACDRSQNYVFVIEPSRKAFCTQSLEDCTCYKKCSDEYVLNKDEHCVRTSTSRIESQQAFLDQIYSRTVHNAHYDDPMYNKEFKTDFRYWTRLVIIITAGAYLCISLFLLFLCPFFLYVHNHTVVVLEDRDVDLQWNIVGISRIRTIQVEKQNDTSVPEEIGDETLHYSCGVLSLKAVIKISYAHKKDEGKYKLSITNLAGITCSSTINLAVNNHPSVIDEWQLKDHKIVETNAFDKVEKILEENNCVAIIGHSGSGKSSIMRRIALKMQKKEQYQIYPVFHPEEIKKHFEKNEKQVFLFDDVFGKFAINLHIVDDWLFSMHEIKEFLSHGNVKIILTCRTHIAKLDHFKNIKWLTSKTCDINEPEFRLSTLNRVKIAKNHKCKEDILRMEDLNPDSDYLFPLMCAVLKTLKDMGKEVKDVITFCKDPFKQIDKLLSNLKLHEKERYAFLALFVVSNNSIEERMFQKKGFMDICRVIRKQCKIEDITIEEMRKHFSEFQKYYTKVSGNKYKIFHDKIFDAVVLFYGKDKEMFDIILQFAHSDIIRERFHFESIKEKPDIAYVIPVSKEKEKKYFKRLFIDTNKEILNNEITFTAFGNRQLEHEEYREKFIEYCKNNDQLKKQITLLSFKVTSPLIEVAAQGYVDILEMLIIEMNLNVNVCDEKGDTPLHKASALGRPKCVDKLLLQGADCFLLNISGETAFFKAVQGGHLDIVEMLFRECDTKEKQLKIVNEINNIGESPLYVASREDHFEIAKYLLKQHAEVEKCHEYKGSPLHAAAKEGNTNIVELLLENGAKVNLSTHHIEAPLYLASRDGKKEAVSLLIKKGANVNDPGMDGRSPLCKAAWNGHKDAVKLLLDVGADPNNVSKYLESPLYKAARVGHTEIVKMLLDNKANVNDCCRDGRSPLYKAAWQNKTEVVQMLLNYGADPNKFSEYFGSPLYRAAKEGHINTVQCLLNWNDTTINLQSKDGETALHGAAKFGHQEIIELLVNNGADITQKNEDGLTALDEGRKMGHKKVVEYLEGLQIQ